MVARLFSRYVLYILVFGLVRFN